LIKTLTIKTTDMPSPLNSIEACVFDAYGTLFDVASAANHCRDDLGELAQPLSDLWRTRQVEYSWLRSLMQEYTDFWQVTGDALDFALASLNIDNPALRDRLMDIYKRLDAYPEVPEVLSTLNNNGIRCAILSNGSPDMLASAVDNAGIASSLEAILSVDEIGIYKPHPDVYQMAVDKLGVKRENICFMSSNGWDAAGAASFGFQVLWVNRFSAEQERLPAEPTGILSSLRGLPDKLGL